jgi:hypothetical protein
MPTMTRGTASTLLPWRIAKRPTKDHAPRSVDTLRASLFALGRGWSTNSVAGGIALALSENSEAGKTVAWRINLEIGGSRLSDRSGRTSFR